MRGRFAALVLSCFLVLAGGYAAITFLPQVILGYLGMPRRYHAYAQTQQAHRFTVEGDHFTPDGKPFQVISGEMHYPRIPRDYWRQRFRMARAMGLNTITTYVFWNLHEPKPGVYDFSGNNDVAEFVREAQQEGLYMILGP